MKIKRWTNKLEKLNCWKTSRAEECLLLWIPARRSVSIGSSHCLVNQGLLLTNTTPSPINAFPAPQACRCRQGAINNALPAVALPQCEGGRNDGVILLSLDSILQHPHKCILLPRCSIMPHGRIERSAFSRCTIPGHRMIFAHSEILVLCK